MNWTVWGPPLAVLGLSAVVGLIVVFRTKGDSSEYQKNADLLARKEQLFEHLRELDADQDKLEPEDYMAERERLIDAAAQILEQLENPSNTSSGVKKSSITSSFAPTFVVLLMAFGGILYGVTQFAKPRSDGQIMTGGQSSMLEELLAERQAEIDAAQVKLSEDANDLNALNILSYDALMRQDLQTAMSYIETARGLQPDQPDVLLHLAILQMQVGMGERAEVGISQALRIRPDFPRALLWRCLIYMRAGDKEAALQDLAAAEGKLKWPEDIGFYNAMQAELVKPPPILTGVINTNQEGVVPEGVLFVIVRRAEQGGGPPVAVLRIASPQFPMPFAVGKGDMVMGGEWPDQVWIEARLDRDGNAMTKDELDWNSDVLGPLSGEQDDLVLDFQGEAKTVAPEPTTAGVLSQLSGQVQFSGSGQGVLFVIVRSADVDRGPPLAVKREINPEFPYHFELSDSDIMMGGEWPDQVWVEARLDGDGNAMTRSSGDWTSIRQGPLPKGEENIVIRLGSQLRE